MSRPRSSSSSTRRSRASTAAERKSSSLRNPLRPPPRNICVLAAAPPRPASEECFRGITRRLRRYFAIARQCARRYLEVDDRVPESRQSDVAEDDASSADSAASPTIRARGVGTIIDKNQVSPTSPSRRNKKLPALVDVGDEEAEED